MRTIYFDVETGPIAKEQIAQFVRPFDREAVKVGNIKDPDKIAAKIQEAEAAHGQSYFDNAALWPCTGEVLCIGLMDPMGSFDYIGNENGERSLLKTFWQKATNIAVDERGRQQWVQLVGWNIKGFDLPFLLLRSWKHRVAPCSGCFQDNGYMDNRIVDLRDRWKQRVYDMKGNLDDVAKFLGIGQKTGDGANFAQLWATDKPAALQYLRNDVDLVRKMHQLMVLGPSNHSGELGYDPDPPILQVETKAAGCRVAG